MQKKADVVIEAFRGLLNAIVTPMMCVMEFPRTGINKPVFFRGKCLLIKYFLHNKKYSLVRNHKTVFLLFVDGSYW
jgi:hypothetical protein